MIQSKLQAELVECGDLYTKQFCPNTKAPPNVVFPVSGGTVSGSSNACCKGNYLQCQLQVRTPLCRELASYTISPEQGNFEERCPDTSYECTCQQALASEKFLKLNFCPIPTNCCPVCECHGDPHCTSFNHDKASTWAVCDDRDETCLHSPETCAVTMYDGKPCVWQQNGGGFNVCVRADGTKEPSMKMYEKTYKDYFNPNSNVLNTFRVTLGLTYYGSIGLILIEDQSISLSFSISAINGRCVTPPKYPMNKQHMVMISDLPSGVLMQLDCVNNGVNAPQRWDIKYVKDPWYTPGQILGSPEQTFAGFCTTGVIDENPDSTTNNGCRLMDRQLAMYFKCPSTTAISTCKAKFCANQGTKLQFPPKAGTTPVSQCTQFVNAADQNFMIAACSLSKLVVRDPTTCMQYAECKQCVDDITDYPDEIPLILAKMVSAPTSPPTSRCPPSGLLTAGLNRKKLLPASSGVQIDFYNAVSKLWEGVFAVLDEEVKACGGCRAVLLANGSDATVQPLLTPGKYRIRQCTGYDPDPTQDLCDGTVGYNATAWFNNPMSGGAVSAAYGPLYDSGALVCSSVMFPKCPFQYKCCIWDRATQPYAWESCMAVYHKGQNYPQCGK